MCSDVYIVHVAQKEIDLSSLLKCVYQIMLLFSQETLQRLTRHSELGPKALKYHHFVDLFSYRFHPSHSVPTTPASPAPIPSTSCWLYPWALQFPDTYPEKLAHPLIYFRSLLQYHLSTGHALAILSKIASPGFFPASFSLSTYTFLYILLIYLLYYAFLTIM